MRAKLLETCLTEFSSLIDAQAYNKNNEWKTTEDELSKLKQITSSFLKYLNGISLDKTDHPHAVDVKESKFLPP